jgi:hypothetical protein
MALLVGITQERLTEIVQEILQEEGKTAAESQQIMETHVAKFTAL